MDYNRINKITTFIFDVDGVLTDSQILITESGDLLRSMSTRDGQAIKFAIDAGYHVAIITKGGSKGVKSRLTGLGISDIYDNLETKQAAYADLISKYNLKSEEILYMGDDLPDIPLIKQVGLSACPNDASSDVLAIAEYISPAKGGHGAVRDVIERIMRCQDKWPSQ